MFNYAKNFWSSPGNGRGGETNTSSTLYPPSSLKQLLTIADQSRHANFIKEAPTLESTPSNVAVITDTLGRVFLIDSEECQLIRMWKGMRDVQCGWVQLADPTHESQQIILLLLIYSSRGVLEVYTMRHGDRILISNIGTGMKLLQTTGYVLGRASSQLKSVKHYAKCFFLSPAGELNEVTFHYDEILKSSTNDLKLRITRLFELYQTSQTDNLRAKHLESIRQLIINGDKNLSDDVKTIPIHSRTGS